MKNAYYYYDQIITFVVFHFTFTRRQPGKITNDVCLNPIFSPLFSSVIYLFVWISVHNWYISDNHYHQPFSTIYFIQIKFGYFYQKKCNPLMKDESTKMKNWIYFSKFLYSILNIFLLTSLPSSSSFEKIVIAY